MVREIRGRRRERRFGLGAILFILAGLLFASRYVASYVIEYEWWKELGQSRTWLSMIGYEFAPETAATLLAFICFWVAHALGTRFAGIRLREHPLYARLVTAALLIFAWMFAAASVDTWTVVRYVGSTVEANTWTDPVFGRPLAFYLFDLPFYEMLRRYILGLAIVSALVYWLSARAWQIRAEFQHLQGAVALDARMLLHLRGGLESLFIRGAAAVFLIGIAIRYWLSRYEMVTNDHGFMTGIDYTNLHVSLPLKVAVVVLCVVAAGFVAAGRWVIAAVLLLSIPIQSIVPGIVSAAYVRPNEISLERPFIQTHIHATRSAFGLEKSVREVDFKAQPNAPIDVAQHKAVLDNVRLWDWDAFHNTITQIQALRSYYTFNDSDVDRYMIDGQYRQVLLSPRELNIDQLPDARTRWVNPHFIYTHGYGVVLAEVNRITPEGSPVLLVQDAPPVVKTPSLKITRPEIYYGEVEHEPVFVHSAEQEFNYPAGSDNQFSRYAGTGGIPVSSFPMRMAAAINEGDVNILLTSYLTPQSRMMIRREVPTRLKTLAAFLQWDSDPYLVITSEGRLVWMLDAYTTSDAHPYSRGITLSTGETVNYVRNAVKATVDAYDGTTRLYIFAPDDPIIRAYHRLFPDLLHPASEMPADLRAHARYPETLFRIQSEIYRTYHMTDPQAFYNKEDVWELSQSMSSQDGKPHRVKPTYIMASLPAQDKPEFLLMTSFTPRTKDNLIGVMLARCDGDNLGQIVVLQLSKQELIFGPMQIGAQINQDQNISKDLTLWNQQGSQVLRGQMLVLPVGNTFLYVDPIYIQAVQGRMPQLKKVVLAVGNRLIYANNYEDALNQLSAGAGQLIQEAEPKPGVTTAAPGSKTAARIEMNDPRIQRIRDHLQRYRTLASQGRWSEAGKELEAIENEVR